VPFTFFRREERRRRSIEAEEAVGATKSKARPEFAIKIHVDNFS